MCIMMSAQERTQLTREEGERTEKMPRLAMRDEHRVVGLEMTRSVKKVETVAKALFHIDYDKVFFSK